MKPGDDNSNLIEHARRSLFITVVVTIFVVVGIKYYGTERVRSAQRDLKVISGLLRVWERETKNRRNRTLGATIAKPFERHDDMYKAYEFELTPYGDGNSSNRSSEAIRCKTMFDLNRYFLIPRGLGRQRYDFGERGSARHLWHELAVQHSRPDTLADFVEIWNELVNIGVAARITEVKPAESLASWDQKYYRISHVRQVDLAREKRGRNNIRLFVPANVKDGISSDDISRSWSRPRELPAEARAHLVRQQGFVETSCWAKGSQNGLRGFQLMIPVHWKNVEYGASDLWQRRAVAAKDLSPEMKVAVVTFKNAFPALYEEMSGKESQTLEAVDRQVRESLEVAGGLIEFQGFSVQRRVLLDFGVIFIALVQLYSTLHVAQASDRLSLSERGMRARSSRGSFSMMVNWRCW